MYSFTYLPNTGAVARNLLALSKLNGSTVTPEIRLLKDQGLLDQSLLPDTLTGAQIGVVQQVLDWNGRGTIVTNTVPEARSLGLVSAALRQPGRILIVCKKANLADWEKLIGSSYPDDLLVRYTTKSAAQDAKWVLTTLTDLMKNKILSDLTFDQCINDDVAPMLNASIRSEGLAGLLREIRSTICLVSLEDQPTYKISDLHSPKSQFTVGLTNVANMLWHTIDMTNLFWNLDGTGGAYLRTRGYLSVAPVDLFPTMGVFTALVR
jgi:hypothetical protein